MTFSLKETVKTTVNCFFKIFAFSDFGLSGTISRKLLKILSSTFRMNVSAIPALAKLKNIAFKFILTVKTAVNGYLRRFIWYLANVSGYFSRKLPMVLRKVFAMYMRAIKWKNEIQ